MTPPATDARRRALCAALSLLAAGAPRAADRLPPVDLVVELRLVDAATVIEGGAAAGSVTIDSRGNLRGAGEVVTLGTTGRGGGAVQAVRVSNGGRARMQVVQTQALAGAVAAWSGRSAVGLPAPHGPRGDAGRDANPAPGRAGVWQGSGASVVTAWAELVDGFEVQPRWPGGRSSVTVEVGAQRRAGTAGDNAPPPRIDVYTTVQAPVGEWVELAQVQRGARATLSIGAATVGTQQSLQLQLRVRPAD